jgi:hypothetical protein
MPRSRFLQIVAITFTLLVGLLPFSAAYAQEAKTGSAELSGKWKMVSLSPEGESINWSLTITQENDHWTGMIGTPEQGQVPAKEFKVETNKVHFKAPYGGEEYDIDLTLDGNKLSGTWNGTAGSGKTSGERAG